MAHKSSVSGRYIGLVAIFSFCAALGVVFLSEILVRRVQNLFLSFSLLIVIVFLNALADIIGTAAAAASTAPLNARAAKKISGAKEGLYLVRNADKVANIMNDVIGDIAGTVSGALGISIVVRIVAAWPQSNDMWLNIIITAVIASLTVASKAVAKKIALTRSTEVIMLAGKVLFFWSRLTGYSFEPKRRR